MLFTIAMDTEKKWFEKFDSQSSYHQQVELKGLFENPKGNCLEIHKLYCWNAMLQYVNFKLYPSFVIHSFIFSVYLYLMSENFP